MHRRDKSSHFNGLHTQRHTAENNITQQLSRVRRNYVVRSCFNILRKTRRRQFMLTRPRLESFLVANACYAHSLWWCCSSNRLRKYSHAHETHEIDVWHVRGAAVCCKCCKLWRGARTCCKPFLMETTYFLAPKYTNTHTWTVTPLTQRCTQYLHLIHLLIERAAGWGVCLCVRAMCLPQPRPRSTQQFN